MLDVIKYNINFYETPTGNLKLAKDFVNCFIKE